MVCKSSKSLKSESMSCQVGQCRWGSSVSFDEWSDSIYFFLVHLGR